MEKPQRELLLDINQNIITLEKRSWSVGENNFWIFIDGMHIMNALKRF